MREIVIANRTIGPGHPPFIVAEMSGNHNQSLDRALEIAEAAASTGAHALKLQTYTADTMTLNIEKGEFAISHPRSPWRGKSLYQLYQQAYTPWEWHETLMGRCRELGLICFSTPFDESAVDFLERLGAPCYKIASFENAHLPLIRKVAATGKPMLISAGLATLADLDETIRTARQAGCQDIVLLKCSTTYPASPEDSNLLTIPHLRSLFGAQVGLSDHTLGIGVAVAAVAHGATLVEKHFTLRRADGGVDSTFSMEPEEMRQLVLETERAWRAMGRVHYGPTEDEAGEFACRRSLYITKNMKAGDVFTPENLRVVRPGRGLPPKYYDVILGRRITRNAEPGTPVGWDLVMPDGGRDP